MAYDPVTAISNTIGKIVDVIGESIEDKDLKNAITADLVKLERETWIGIVQTKTTPRMDAFIKLVYAMSDVGMRLFRPTISAASLAFVAYGQYKGWEIPQAFEVVLASLFPGWMASRHVQKARDSQAARTENAGPSRARSDSEPSDEPEEVKRPPDSRPELDVGG